MTRLLVASRNRKKLAELHRVLDGAGITGVELVSLDDVPPYDEAPETGRRGRGGPNGLAGEER